MPEEGRSSNDEFFTQLTALFEGRKAKSHGSIFLMQKRLTPRIAPRSRSPPSASPASLARTPRTASSPASPTTPSGASADHLDAALAELEAPGEPLPLLIRATNGKGKEKRHEKILFSTIVQPDEIEGFFTRYAEVCKGGMSGGLRKRDKKGKGKKKTKGREGKEKVGGEERAG